MTGLNYGTFPESEALFQRYEFVRALKREGRDATELEEEVDVSQSTVRRATRLLEDEGLIESSDESFCLTKKGEVALESFELLKRSLDSMEAHGSGLDSFSPEIDERLLIDAEFVENQPLKRLGEVFEGTDVYRSIYGGHRWEILPAMKKLTDGRGRIEMILPKDRIDTLLTYFTEKINTGMTEERLTLRSIEENAPTGLHFTHSSGVSKVLTEITGPDGDLASIGISSSPRAIEAFHETYQTYREGSELVEI